MQFLRKISTSKQLFVQRLDEEDGDDEEVEEELNLQRDLELDVNSNCPVTEAIYEELQLSECNQALTWPPPRRWRWRNCSQRPSMTCAPNT